MHGIPSKDLNITALLKTRLHPAPLRSGVVHRQRLINKLSEGKKSGAKLTLVSAPAGYGKSTLVTDWIQQEKIEYAWLSVEEEDNILAPFFINLVTSLQEIRGDTGEVIKSLFASPRIPPINALISIFIQELETLPSPLVIVLDDYHFITNQIINQGIAYLIEHLPLNYHLVIISRQDPPISLGRLRVNNLLTELRMKDLKFSKEETAIFFDKNFQIPLGEEEVSILGSRTEGWISGLQLAGLSLKESAEEERKVFIKNFSGTNRFVIDYLFEEVMEKQRPEIKDFLCKTSVLNRFNASLCNTLTGSTGSQQILLKLDKANNFLISLEAKKHWYRYHHLFRDFLISELSTREKKILHSRAAGWYETNGYLHEAIYHAREAGDLETLERLIAELAIELFNRGEIETLIEYLEKLPGERLKTNSQLLIYKAWCLFLTGKGKEISSYLKIIKDREDIEENDSSYGLFLALLVFFDKQSNTLELAEKAENIIDRDEYFYRIAALLSLGQVQASSGKCLDAVQTFKEAVEVGEQTSFYFGSITALINLAVNLNWLGRRKEAILICEKSLYEYTGPDGKIYPLANLIYILLGMLHYENNELDTAYDYLEKGISFCREWSFVRIMGLGEWYMGRTLFALGKKEESFKFVEETIALGKKLGLNGLIFFMNCLKADLNLKAGNNDKAFLWAEEIKDLVNNIQDISGKFLDFTYVRILLCKKEIDHARDILSKMIGSGVEGRNLIIIRLLQTRAYFLDNKEEKALNCLSEAVQLAAPEGYVRVFLNEGETIYRLLPEIKDTSPAFIKHILEAFNLKNVSSKNQALIEPLTERELEILELIVNGLSNKDIAKKLYITVGTTKWHINNIYGKLGVNKRTRAIKKALQLKLVGTPG